MPDGALLEQTRAACRDALEQGAELAPLWRAGREGPAAALFQESRRLLPRVRTYGDAVPRLAEIKDRLAAERLPVAGGAFERMLIVAAALDAIDRLPALTVDDHVKALFCRNFQDYATPGKLPEAFDLSRPTFIAMGRLATLSRFPAGQLDWEVSGVPKSWLLKVPRRSLPRLLSLIAVGLGGFQPAFFSHLNPNRRNRGILLERESLRSYHRMARSMARQPEIRGLITASWLHSADTFRVSPHLAWLNTVFLEHGGGVVPLGRADPDSGVLHRSPERQQAYEAGTFTPTEALAIWPRRAMLAWAERHDDLRDDRVRPARAASLQEARA